MTRRTGIIARLLVGAVALLAGCGVDRPVHPLRLEGFPGAPIEPGLFPLRDGARWTFSDTEGNSLVLSVRRAGEAYLLAGRKEAEAAIRVEDGYLEILRDGELVDRPLKLAGRVGDSWSAAGATYTVFGYDEVEVLGRRVRALVVAADRPPARDLYWYAPDLGWVRLRTERNGKTMRDARLVAFEPGSAG